MNEAADGYADFQQRRGVFADIVDEALASFHAWKAEDNSDASGLLKIMNRMEQRRNALVTGQDASK